MGPAVTCAKRGGQEYEATQSFTDACVAGHGDERSGAAGATGGPDGGSSAGPSGGGGGRTRARRGTDQFDERRRFGAARRFGRRGSGGDQRSVDGRRPCSDRGGRAR